MTSDDNTPSGPSRAISAIRTRYRGFLTRSRLEARWACFFDWLGVEFWYEPEGFVLTDGTPYLPDFFLPMTRTWAECKPLDPTPEERAKIEALALGTRQMCLLLAGPPDFRAYYGVSLDAGELTVCTYSLDIYQQGRKLHDEERRFFSCPTVEMTSQECASPEYVEAIFASREARFDGTDPLPQPREIFNLSDAEIRAVWKKAKA